MSVFADGADQTGKTTRGLAVRAMVGRSHDILRCIALAQRQVEVCLGQAVGHVVLYAR
jgi:hypothetical protein